MNYTLLRMVIVLYGLWGILSLIQVITKYI